MASDEEYGRPSRKNWFDQMDELEWDDDEAERLPCSVDYVTSCLLLPCLNGCINGFAGSVQAIYFKDMGWPLWRLGLALALGFSSRLLTQRVQVRFGIWTAVPMSTLLGLAVAAAGAMPGPRYLNCAILGIHDKPRITKQKLRNNDSK
eukprot:Skav235034  [mRNA]  locus=scaffold287:7209:9798:+ [translate_table: standard]